jgi:hypothetical protein
LYPSHPYRGAPSQVSITSSPIALPFLAKQHKSPKDVSEASPDLLGLPAAKISGNNRINLTHRS